MYQKQVDAAAVRQCICIIVTNLALWLPKTNKAYLLTYLHCSESGSSVAASDARAGGGGDIQYTASCRRCYTHQWRRFSLLLYLCARPKSLNFTVDARSLLLAKTIVGPTLVGLALYLAWYMA